MPSTCNTHGWQTMNLLSFHIDEMAPHYFLFLGQDVLGLGERMTVLTYRYRQCLLTDQLPNRLLLLSVARTRQCHLAPLRLTHLACRCLTCWNLLSFVCSCCPPICHCSWSQSTNGYSLNVYSSYTTQALSAVSCVRDIVSVHLHQGVLATIASQGQH